MESEVAGSFAVVIPMYNEKANARLCIETIHEATQRANGRLIVVDDGSRDGTGEFVLELTSRPDLSFDVVLCEQNGGYGFALRRGVERARSEGIEWVLFMDSDLTNPPNDIAAFAQAMTPGIDMIKASRYIPGGDASSVSTKRRIFSVTANRIARALGGGPFTDPTNGFRAIRVDLFLSMPLTERGFPIILEEYYYARLAGARGAELPTTLTERTDIQSTSSFNYTPPLLWSYAKWALRLARDRVAGRIPRATGNPSDHPGTGTN